MGTEALTPHLRLGGLPKGTPLATMHDRNSLGHTGGDNHGCVLNHRTDKPAMMPALVRIAHVTANRLKKTIVIGTH